MATRDQPRVSNSADLRMLGRTAPVMHQSYLTNRPNRKYRVGQHIGGVGAAVRARIWVSALREFTFRITLHKIKSQTKS